MSKSPDYKNSRPDKIRGVTRDRDKWRALVTVDGKSKFLGRFDRIKEALQAIKEFHERRTTSI